MAWIATLNSKNLSILLTLVTLVLLTVAGALQIFGKVNGVTPFDTMFYASLSLVFGSHHLNINGKSFSSDTTPGDSK
jgi:hypothetical protein